MKLNNGLSVGFSGGHGPIRYVVIDYDPNSHITFKFIQPEGFSGTHKFEIAAIDTTHTNVKHTIRMRTNFWGSIQWFVAIRWLHDALIEDAFDNIQHHLGADAVPNRWSLYVKFLRTLLKP